MSDEAPAAVGITALAVVGGSVEVDDDGDGDGWQVLRDPEGSELCLLRPRT